MAFDFYTNIVGTRSDGKKIAWLYTDDATLLAAATNGLKGKYLYINGMPFGKIASNARVANGTTITHYNTDGTVDGPGAILTPVTTMGIEIMTGLQNSDTITEVGAKDIFSHFNGNLPVANRIKFYSTDSAFITAAENAYANQGCFINGSSIGTIISNKLFDGNSSSSANAIDVLYNYNGSDIVGSMPTSSFIAMEFVIEVTAPCIAVVNSFLVRAVVSGKYFYANNTNTVHEKFMVNEFAALYQVGGDTTDATQQPALYYAMHTPIKDGNLALFINDKYVGPVAGMPYIYGYADKTPGQPLLVSNDINPWSLDNWVGFYPISKLGGIANFTEAITTVDFKPLYLSSYNSLTNVFRIGASSGPLADLVSGYSTGKDLYVNGIKIGAITNHGVTDLYIDGRGPINLSGYSANAGYPNAKEYYFEVANPLAIPDIDQSVIVRTDASYSLTSGRTITQLPTIVGSLVGKRLIINEVYVGLIESNTDTTITTYADITVSVGNIWRLETTDNVGRAPLCVGTQLSLSEWPEYTHLDIPDFQYDTSYMYTDDQFTYYPDGINVATQRSTTNYNTDSEQCLGYTLPNWVEHAHLNPIAHTFMLAGEFKQDIVDPIAARYAVRISKLTDARLSKFWQSGRVVVKEYTDFDATTTGPISYNNIPGELDSITPSTISAMENLVYNAYVLVPEIVTSPANGLLTAGLIFETTTGYVQVALNGTLPAGTILVTATGTVTVLFDGTVPTGTVLTVITTLTVDSSQFLIPGTTLVTPTGTVTVDDTGLLPPGTTLYIPGGTIVVDSNGQLPVGTILITTIVTPVVASTRSTLSTSTVVIVATAPTAVSIECSVLSLVSPTAIEFSNLVMQKTAVVSEDDELISVQFLECISNNISLYSNITKLMTPTVTTTTQVEKAVSPAIPGTRIQFKRGLRADLPASANIGEPLVTLDTGELFVGTGAGLRKISDVIVSETEPLVADRNKLWFSPIENITRVYKDGAWQISGSEASMDYGTF